MTDATETGAAFAALEQAITNSDNYPADLQRGVKRLQGLLHEQKVAHADRRAEIIRAGRERWGGPGFGITLTEATGEITAAHDHFMRPIPTEDLPPFREYLQAQAEDEADARSSFTARGMR